MTIPGQIPTVFLPVNVIAAIPNPDPTPFAAQPLQDPRSHPLTRVAGEGLVTWGRGQSPNSPSSAGLQR